MCITVSRAHLPQMKPKTVTYRSYNKFNQCNFRYELRSALNHNMGYEDFENIFEHTQQACALKKRASRQMKHLL